MTRLIAGRLRGRTLTVPRSGTRPTTDRVREALFSAITARMDLDGAAVLDLFAGSGALGLEAVSRGATTAWFVERGVPAVACLRANTRDVGGAELVVRRGSLPEALHGPCPRPGGFDLVLADPPYGIAFELDAPVLAALVAGGWLAPDALVVWERSRRTAAVRWPDGFAPELARDYGETSVELAWAPGEEGIGSVP